MLLKDGPARPSGRRFSAADQAKALAVVLHEEFGVPFVFYHAPVGQVSNLPVPLGRLEPCPTAPDGDARQPLAAEVAAQVAANGRVRVLPLADDRSQLVLPLYEAGRPILVATGNLAVGDRERTAGGSRQSLAWLEKWLQAVADRLRLADQLACQQRSEEEQHLQATVCWEALLTLPHLIHRLRIHKDPVKNQRRILESAAALIDVQTLIWVPQAADAPVLIHGEPCLAPVDCRNLALLLATTRRAGAAPDTSSADPILCNDVQAQGWGTRFPQLHTLAAFPVSDQGPLGWFVAVNKKGSGVRGQAGSSDRTPESCPLTPFRKSDAALLTPFVALLGLYVRATDRYQDLKELLVGLTRSLTSALDAKDSYTYGHSERVARIAVELGREMGLSGDELGDIYLTGLLHDVGKIGIRDAILAKVHPLTPEEFEHIKQHVTIGYTILADLRPIRNLLPGVLYHHERIDGTGYPDGLVGEAIPLLARILAVADAYDAMSTTRPYREAMPCRMVEETLVQGAGTQWDKQVVEAFLRCRLKIHAIRQRGVGDSLRQAIDGALRKDGSSVQWHPSHAAAVPNGKGNG
jgi:HD-GYP domain-containing protein (c-di-GMP phosphodiesterase class II)